MSKSLTTLAKKKTRAASTRQYTAQDPAYLPKVVKKVKKHPDFRDLSDDEAREKAKQLTEVSELHADFSHLLDMQFEEQVCQTRDEADRLHYGGKLANEPEREDARIRAAERLKRVSEMPIKLQLSELKREFIPMRFAVDQFAKLFAAKYGLMHAALVVGDVTLEWNESSLVVPEHEVYDPNIEMDIRGDTAAMKAIAAREPAMQAAVKNINYNTQMEHIYTATVDRAKMIEALKEVIATYNKYYHYDMITRNCQTFVIEAMQAMGIKEPPKLTGRLKEYYLELRKGKQKAPDDFKTHEELDQYIRKSQSTGEFDQLTQHDKEFLLCLYFKFHLETLEEDKGEDCKVHDCMKGELEKAIDFPVILEEYCSSVPLESD